MSDIKPSAYKWTGPTGRVEYSDEGTCSASAADAGWRAEPLYDRATLDAAVAAERERCAEIAEGFDACDPRHITAATEQKT